MKFENTINHNIIKAIAAGAISLTSAFIFQGIKTTTKKRRLATVASPTLKDVEEQYRKYVESTVRSYIDGRKTDNASFELFGYVTIIRTISRVGVWGEVFNCMGHPYIEYKFISSTVKEAASRAIDFIFSSRKIKVITAELHYSVSTGNEASQILLAAKQCLKKSAQNNTRADFDDTSEKIHATKCGDLGNEKNQETDESISITESELESIIESPTKRPVNARKLFMTKREIEKYREYVTNTVNDYIESLRSSENAYFVIFDYGVCIRRVLNANEVYCSVYLCSDVDSSGMLYHFQSFDYRYAARCAIDFIFDECGNEFKADDRIDTGDVAYQKIISSNKLAKVLYVTTPISFDEGPVTPTPLDNDPATESSCTTEDELDDDDSTEVIPTDSVVV